MRACVGVVLGLGVGLLAVAPSAGEPARRDRIAHIPSVVVDSGGTTSIALRVAYRPSWEDYGPFLEGATQIVRVANDGRVAGCLSLDAAAERARLGAHDGFVDIAFDADLRGDGDRAVYWQQIGPDGTFTGAPVRLSAPVQSGDPDPNVGIWDVFLGVDAGSSFHLAVFGTRACRSRPGKDRRIAPSLYLSSLEAGEEASRVRRIRIRKRPQYIWSYEVAGDGTRMIAGRRLVRTYHRDRSKRRDDVTVIFADPAGRPLHRATFRNPEMTNPKQPVLASTSAGGRDRFAAAWSGWWAPDRPDNRYVRVVIFERVGGSR